MMSFPDTSLTLVQRLASQGGEDDWRLFLKDYWGPICRFSMRWGARDLDDAEEIASQTFEVIWRNQLLVRWGNHRSAKLRTLLCGVVRNILSNRHRVRAGRDRLARDLADHVEKLSQARDEQVDSFYAAWVEDLIQRAVESLATEYYRKNQGDYMRVLYGRLCEQLTLAKVSQALQIKPSTVNYYFDRARRRLSEKLQELLRRQARHYCTAEQVEEELALEWRRLGEHLTEHGGLDEAVRRAYDLFDPIQGKNRRQAELTRALTRLTAISRSPVDASDDDKTS